KDRCPLDPALVGGLLSLNPLQDGPLCRGDLDRGRSWSLHQLAPSARAGTIRSEPILWSPPSSGQRLLPPCTRAPPRRTGRTPPSPRGPAAALLPPGTAAPWR